MYGYLVVSVYEVTYMYGCVVVFVCEVTYTYGHVVVFVYVIVYIHTHIHIYILTHAQQSTSVSSFPKIVRNVVKAYVDTHVLFLVEEWKEIYADNIHTRTGC